MVDARGDEPARSHFPLHRRTRPRAPPFVRRLPGAVQPAECRPLREKPLVRLLLQDILSVLGRRYLAYVGLLTVTGLMEAVSLAAAVPLLASVGVGSSGPGAGGRIGALAVTLLGTLGVAPTPLAICTVVIAAMAISTTMFLSHAYLGARLQTSYVYRWQQRLA